MAKWVESVMRVGGIVSFDLEVGSKYFLRIEPSDNGWGVGYVTDVKYVAVAGPFPTLDTAKLAAELMFE